MTYSNKDFTNRDLSDRTDMSNQVIEGSCFSQEILDRHIFPADMTGTTFVACNLDNCVIPAGNTVSACCSRRRFQVQGDGFDWLLDEDNNPIERM